jgi:hypothetical protein
MGGTHTTGKRAGLLVFLLDHLLVLAFSLSLPKVTAQTFQLVLHLIVFLTLQLGLALGQQSKVEALDEHRVFRVTAKVHTLCLDLAG